MNTADKLAQASDAAQPEMEDVFWGVLAYAMTHQPNGERLALGILIDPATFDSSILPSVRRAWTRTVEAVALESLVEHGHPMPDLDADDPDDGEDG